MKAIWKFPFDITDAQTLEMPQGAEILHCAAQPVGDGSRQSYIWALVDVDAPRVGRLISVYGTGHPVTADPGKHIGTLIGIVLVFHVFDRGEKA